MAFKSIFEKDFRYRNACSTDIRLTFERIRREQRQEKPRAESAETAYATKALAAAGGRPAG